MHVKFSKVARLKLCQIKLNTSTVYYICDLNPVNSKRESFRQIYAHQKITYYTVNFVEERREREGGGERKYL